MTLPLAPAQYSQEDQRRLRNEIEKLDRQNFKRQQDAEPVGLILKDTVTGFRYKIEVQSGVLVPVAL